MSSIETFKLVCLRNNYLCTDVLYYVILRQIEKCYCRACEKWIGETCVNACFFNTHVLCFYCYHRKKYPIS